VGSISDSRGLKKATVWDHGKATSLGVPVGWAQSWAVAVNNRGQVAAIAANKADTRRHAFLWQEGGWVDLGTLGGASSGSFAINERGQVVGASGVQGGKEHAFVWDNGHMSDLGTLSGNDARAVDINDQGVIVGSATLDPQYSDPTHAVVWTSS
jgi:probable HAF family extracellular repeat protein